MDFSVGDIITMKKPHPCGASDFEILRVGADLRLKCLGCGHQMTVPRNKITPHVRLLRKADAADTKI